MATNAPRRCAFLRPIVVSDWMAGLARRYKLSYRANGVDGLHSMKISAAEFERLAIEQMDTLYRIARRLTRNPQFAEDLVQETYVRALGHRDTFDLQDYGIGPWLIRILRNLFLNKSQRESKSPRAIQQEQLESAGGAADGDSLPIDPASLECMDERLVAALEALPDEYGTALMLWAVDEYSYKEIASALDVPIGTVMSRLHRARAKLSEQLQDLARETRIIRE